MSGLLHKTTSVRSADHWYRQWVGQRLKSGASSDNSNSAKYDNRNGVSVNQRASSRSRGGARGACDRRLANTVSLASVASQRKNTGYRTPRQQQHQSPKQLFASSGVGSGGIINVPAEQKDTSTSLTISKRLSTVGDPVPELLSLTKHELSKRWKAMEGSPEPPSRVSSGASSEQRTTPRTKSVAPKLFVATDVVVTSDSNSFGFGSPRGDTKKTHVPQLTPRAGTTIASGLHSSAKIGEALMQTKRLFEAGLLSENEFNAISKQIVDVDFSADGHGDVFDGTLQFTTNATATAEQVHGHLHPSANDEHDSVSRRLQISLNTDPQHTDQPHTSFQIQAGDIRPSPALQDHPGAPVIMPSDPSEPPRPSVRPHRSVSHSPGSVTDPFQTMNASGQFTTQSATSLAPAAVENTRLVDHFPVVAAHRPLQEQTYETNVQSSQQQYFQIVDPGFPLHDDDPGHLARHSEQDVAKITGMFCLFPVVWM